MKNWLTRCDVYARYTRPIDAVRVWVGALPKPLRQRLVLFRGSTDTRSVRPIRLAALHSLAQSCGDLVDGHSNCTLLGVKKLRLGSRISIRPTYYVDATGGVTFGDGVSIAHECTTVSTSHKWASRGIVCRDRTVEMRETTIEDDVWIGAGARVLAGVTTQTRSVVGAGAAVTKEVPAGSIVAGLPAPKVGEVERA